MAITAGAIMDEAAALVGDRNKSLYTYTRQLPLLRRALRRLWSALVERDLTTVEETHTSSVVTAGTKVYPNPPADLILPIDLWERPASSTSDADYVLMKQRDWDPAEALVEPLEVWKWEDEAILFRGATTDRTVLLKYKKSSIVIVDQNTIITITDSDSFLAAKTAEFCARSIGKNFTLAIELKGEAKESLDELLNAKVKEGQNLVVRMLPYDMNNRRL